MKKIAALCMAMLLLTLAIVPAFASGSVTMYVKTEDHKPVKVRCGEGTQYAVLRKVDYAQPVLVVENRGTWSAVVVDGLEGFIMTRFLSFTKPSGEALPGAPVEPIKIISYSSFRKVTPYTAIVRSSRPGGFVNLRWAPDTSVATIKKMYDGSLVTVICQGKDWYQVMDPVEGWVGFMSSSFLVH